MLTGTGTRVTGSGGGGFFKVADIAQVVNPDPSGTPAQIAAAAKLLTETYDENAYTDTRLRADIDSIKGYCARSSANVVAVATGDWSSNSTWYNTTSGTQVKPVAGDKILIPQNFTVTYDENTTTEYDTLRVDGIFEFDTAADRKIVLDTIYIDHTGQFKAGASGSGNHVPDTTTITIEYADNGDLDVTNDPVKMQRGFVCFGRAQIYGAPKVVKARTTAGLTAGATSLTLDRQVQGVPDFTDWKVGDEILIAGTRMKGFSGGKNGTWEPSESEVRTITAIDNSTPTAPVISFAALTNPHPVDHLNSSNTPWVGNLTRNIKTYTAGSPANAQHRAHQLFKNKDQNTIQYVEAYGMGRTDMDFVTLGVEPTQLGSGAAITNTTNTNGRYTWHFHRNGFDDPTLNPSIFRGCTGRDAPGWMFVHHDSHGEMHDCIAYDFQAVGFAGEGGGSWGEINNCWADTQREPWDILKSASTRLKNGGHGIGDVGCAFWINSRPLKIKNSIGSNCQAGLFWTSRVSFGTDVSPLTTAEPKAFYGLTSEVQKAFAVIEGFENNEAFACNFGGSVAKKQPNQHHSLRSFLNGFNAWEVENGFQQQYTGMYTLKDFTIHGFDSSHRTGTPNNPNIGLDLFRQSIEVVTVNADINTMSRGISHTAVGGYNTSTYMKHVHVNPTFANCTNNYTVDSTDITAAVTDSGWSNESNGNIDAIERTTASLTSSVAGAITSRYTEDSCTWDGTGNFGIADDFFYTDSLGENSRFSGRVNSEFGLGDTITGQVEPAGAGKTGKDWGIFIILTKTQMEAMIIQEGVYTSAAGDKVLLLPDVVQDRTSGTTTYFFTPIALRIPQSQFDDLAPNDNGALGTHGGQNFSTFDPAGVNGLT